MESSRHILVMDREDRARSRLEHALTDQGYIVTGTADLAAAKSNLLNGSPVDALFLDLNENKAIDFLKEVRAELPVPVIVMSSHAQVEFVLEAIQAGATDFLGKPFHLNELRIVLKKLEERERLKSENELLRAQVSKRYSFSNIIARSPEMLSIFDTIRKVADYRTTITLQGESGTGKELVARALHYSSIRKNKPFIAINCGAIPENLLESELFGHKRGAFTDATRDKKGLFEEANGGTLLLDEIGELPLHLQVKLLRVLQENEIRPVGDSRVIPVDVRIVAATLRDLESDTLAGRFRDDLYYRLNVISIRIPALRERKEDIPLLINHFLKKNQEKLGLAVYGVSREAMNLLLEYDWPGNIRELENCIERAMILTDCEEISVESLPSQLRRMESKPAVVRDDSNLSIKYHSRVMEEDLIRRALEKTKGNRTHAAKILEISHRTLLYKLKEFGFEGAEEDEGAA